ncbi:plant UBX domain-containing protein 8-like isoform X2 [Magnolia sinica]|uniref:plant UBX domain-containing protein 8-like isoform X2 n=1 Tax=Magnolia sinica TaxID=86752 RepID=UPI00265862F6|nr:plant UBX domain-containing protein 8-like isoform X2 [Magnolia sinica]
MLISVKEIEPAKCVEFSSPMCSTHPTSVPVPQNDFMAIDDPIQDEPQGLPPPLLSAARSFNPFSVLDSNFGRNFFDGRGAAEFLSHAPLVSHPREVREIPIEFKDGNGQSGNSGTRPTIEDVTESAHTHGPEIHGNVIIDDDDLPEAPTPHAAGQTERKDDVSERRPGPSAPLLADVTDYSNDIEEEMLQAAIEASKREVEEGYPKEPFGVPNDLSIPRVEQRPSHSEDVELARAVSLSLQTAEQEKALREQKVVVGTAEQGVLNSSGIEDLGSLPVANGRQGSASSKRETSSQFKHEAGGSSVQEEAEEVEEQPLVRHRSRRLASGPAESTTEVGQVVDSPPSSPGPSIVAPRPQHNGDAFHSDEWGGISSEEHDEAVMLEAALFGGIPEGTAYRFAYPSHQVLQTGSDRTADLYPRRVPRSPSPSLTAQRLLREQQDDEYLAALQADREKELKAIEDAEMRRIEEAAAREAALLEEKKREEEIRRKLLEEEEFERLLAAKQASLPQEPSPDDESAVTLLVRMPDGSRRGRRFLKSDKLQSLFDFIDVSRGVKPGSYRLVRPYPRRAFSDGESQLSLSELGLSSKQEALFLELI